MKSSFAWAFGLGLNVVGANNSGGSPKTAAAFVAYHNYWTVRVNVAFDVVFWASLPVAVTVTVYDPAVVPGLVVMGVLGLLTVPPPAPPHPDRTKPPMTAVTRARAAIERNRFLDPGENNHNNPASTSPPPAPFHGL